MILEHYKALSIHQNVIQSDTYFWYSTTGWMMWNYSLSSLLIGATLCIYNGSPVYPDKGVLWRFAKKAKIKTDNEVKKATISAYGNALVSQERVEILKRNLENVKKKIVTCDM